VRWVLCHHGTTVERLPAEENDRRTSKSLPVRNLGGGKYEFSLGPLPPGAYQVTVGSMSGVADQVDPVVDTLIVSPQDQGSVP